MADFNKCREGLHPLITITSEEAELDVLRVVRWCPQCGAIVVDADLDGRTYPGHFRKMVVPESAKLQGCK